MAEKYVQIEHPKTGERYEIPLSAFGKADLYKDPKTGETKSYEDAGFKIVANADGSAYEAPTASKSTKPATSADSEEA